MTWNAFILPLTLITVQLVKQTPIDKKWLPWLACGLGAVFGALWATALKSSEAITFVEYIVQGLIYGASAAGIYDAGATFKANEWEEDQNDTSN